MPAVLKSAMRSKAEDSTREQVWQCQKGLSPFGSSYVWHPGCQDWIEVVSEGEHTQRMLDVKMKLMHGHVHMPAAAPPVEMLECICACGGTFQSCSDMAI